MTSSGVRKNMRSLHNKHRKKHNARSLKLNADLNRGAQKVANAYGRNNYWPSPNHERPNGRSFNWWMNHYYGNRWGPMSENLGRGWERSVDVFGPQSRHGGSGNQWTTSTGHHNILSSKTFTHLGIAYYKSKRIGRVWVAHYARR